MDSSNEWKRLGKAALVAVPVVTAFYGYWYLKNYLSLKVLPGYTAAEGEQRNAQLKANRRGKMQFRVVDVDGALPMQTDVMTMLAPHLVSLRHMGPPLRMDCSFSLFYEFERALSAGFGTLTDDDAAAAGPVVTFYGSNDFHHLTLALVRRFRQPFNIVLFDNHPDWVELYPGLHCGSWFNHTCNLPTVQQAFHFGGYSGEFEDKELRWMTPWKLLVGKNPKIKVCPATNSFKGMRWEETNQEPIRPVWHKPTTKERMLAILEPYREVLSKYPLYITLDKDVMMRSENLQNWNSGLLTRDEVLLIIEVLLELSGGRLLAIDITGDFTKVEVAGMYRNYLHKTQHDDSENNIDQEQATFINQRTNIALVRGLAKMLSSETPSSSDS